MAMNENEIGYALRQQSSQLAELRRAMEGLTSSSGVLSDYKRTLVNVTKNLDDLQNSLRTTTTDRDELRRQVDNLRGQITDFQSRFDLDKQSVQRPRTIDDIPGIRTPQWYTVEVEFAGGETVTKFGTSEIAPEGPFIITQINPLFQILDTTAPANQLGRMIPVSGAYAYYSQLGGTGGTGTVAQISTGIADVPEFTFQIEIQGSGRFWTDLKVPGAFFYGNNNPMYTGIMGWVDYSDRIKIHATPERAVPLAGKVLFGLHGYQILNPVKLTQMLGFA